MQNFKLTERLKIVLLKKFPVFLIQRMDSKNYEITFTVDYPSGVVTRAQTSSFTINIFVTNSLCPPCATVIRHLTFNSKIADWTDWKDLQLVIPRDVNASENVFSISG